jgi:HlyD family type I secretion membrane fusion protein
MHLTLSPRPRPPVDLIAAPISAFESDTQAVIQRTTPYGEHAILHTIAGMLVLAMALMCVVKLDRIVTSSGKILPTKGSIFVQPLDRAIISSIQVRNGDVVRKGQVLATLDPTAAAADLKDLEQKKNSDEALVTRLKAEQDGKPFAAADSSPYELMQAQIYNQRQTEYRQSINDFDAKIRSDQTVIAQNARDASDYRSRLGLAKELEQAQVTLQSKGFGSRVLTIQATDNRIETGRLMVQAQYQATQSQHDLESIEAQRAGYIGKWRDDLTTQLVAAQNDLDSTNQSLTKAIQARNLTNLTAPEDAVVLKVAQASAGSVIDASTSATTTEPLFTLTPLNDALEAEVKVASQDIGFIRVGDPVRIKLDAYKFTTYGTAKGVIKSISEGSFVLGDDGTPVPPYFRVVVRLTDVHLRNVPASFRLIPGMTLDGDIVVGRRTIMSYLLEGALRTGSEAMREP